MTVFRRELLVYEDELRNKNLTVKIPSGEITQLMETSSFISIRPFALGIPSVSLLLPIYLFPG